MTNLRLWLKRNQGERTPRPQRVRHLAREADEARELGNWAEAEQLELAANQLLDDEMDLRRHLQSALFDLGAAIRRLAAARPSGCWYATPDDGYEPHAEMRPLFDEVARLQEQVGQFTLDIHLGAEDIVRTLEIPDSWVLPPMRVPWSAPAELESAKRCMGEEQSHQDGR